MSETDATPDARRARPLRRGVLIGLALAPLAGAAGFFAVGRGLVSLPGAHSDKAKPAAAVDYAFVPVDPLLISLGRAGSGRFLRFQAQLEVGLPYVAEVQSLLPRVVDVLNGYLRALDVADVEDPAALIRLRGQMLRRVQIVTGEGRVRDLLIMEFVVS